MKQKHVKRLKKLYSLLLKVDSNRLDFTGWTSLDEAITGNSFKDIKGTFCAGGLAMQHKWFNKRGLGISHCGSPSYKNTDPGLESLKDFFGISMKSYNKIFSMGANVNSCMKELKRLIEKHEKASIKQPTETLFNIVLVHIDSSTTNILVKARSLEDAVNTAVYHTPHPQRIKFALTCVVDIKEADSTPEKIIKDFVNTDNYITFNLIESEY